MRRYHYGSILTQRRPNHTHSQSDSLQGLRPRDPVRGPVVSIAFANQSILELLKSQFLSPFGVPNVARKSSKIELRAMFFERFAEYSFRGLKINDFHTFSEGPNPLEHRQGR